MHFNLKPEITFPSIRLPRATAGRSTEVNAAPQQIGRDRVGRIQVPQYITQDLVAGPDDEDPAVQAAVDGVIGDGDRFRLHIRVGVIHHDPKVPQVDALVSGHFAMVKAIEIDALPVDPREAIAGIDAAVGVAGRIDGHRYGAVLHIDLVYRISDKLAAVALHPYLSRVPHLDRVSAN